MENSRKVKTKLQSIYFAPRIRINILYLNRTELKSDGGWENRRVDLNFYLRQTTGPGVAAYRKNGDVERYRAEIDRPVAQAWLSFIEFRNRTFCMLCLSALEEWPSHADESQFEVDQSNTESNAVIDDDWMLTV